MALFGSIWDDIRHTFRIGNMVMRLIIINFGIFILVNVAFLILLIIQGPEAASVSLWDGLEWLCIPASGRTLLFQPWSPFTHMFLHESFWHVVSNIIGLYLFGVIVGDLIGDRRILPIYLLGGLFGGLMFMASAQFAPYVGSYALGASGAVMALAGAALILAPDYRVRLILLGEVKVKYIVLVLLLFDLIGVANKYNSGGHVAHLGGFAMGCLFVYRLRDGHDWAEPINRTLDRAMGWFSGAAAVPASPPKRKAQKAFTGTFTATKGGRAPQDNNSFQQRLDSILDKIKETGYESLTPEEKEFLYKASKK
ncbi:MAG: rhomboid family intramembrane serine protease [Bacteroidetes bacterium]|nr:MAG: rhomboid family intramembrane serine protease [Bacteroidota bacterium]